VLLFSSAQIQDQKARLIGIPIVALISTVATRSTTPFEYTRILIVSLLVTFVIWQSVRCMIIAARKKYPGLQHIRQRILVLGSCVILFTSFILVIYSYTYTWFFSHKILPVKVMWINLSTGLLITLLICTIYECVYFFGEWRKTIVISERLKQQQIISQFETLKSQIKPHFLFNSLNTLTVLIEENPTQAVQFVQQLSQVYRYILIFRDKKVVSLQEELEFIRAYLFLLQIRFGKHLRVKISINEKFLDYQLPPLSLQLLVENAIKHNIVSSRHPLDLIISTSDDQKLIIQNTVQKKQTVEPSSGFGLNTIAEQYLLLGKQQIHTEETSTIFKVVLPLIASSY
jgi:hypothetical protein